MTDTAPEIAEYMSNIYHEKSGEEKLLMALSMFDAARELVKASLPGDLSPAELRKAIFTRFYSNDFSAAERNNILSALDAYTG